MDIPRAWEISKAVPPSEHDPRCSTAQTDGALLCDCAVLTEHPEYDVPTTAPDPGAGALHAAVSNGFFEDEQDAVAQEAAWAEQMESEEPSLVPAEIVAHGNFEIQPSNDEEIDAPLHPLDIPDEYDLPMHGSILCCPKCGNDKVKTTWHAHGVLSEPCGTRFGWPNVQNLGEHLCRTCIRCQYGWPEEVFSGA